MLSTSVAMPVYNAERYIGSAIESILAQDLPDFEFVIVDDGSTDGSAEVIERYAARDSRIRFLRQPNRGAGAARAAATSICTGQYVAMMDADDISLPPRLRLQKAFLDAHPDIDAVGSQWRMMDMEGRLLDLDTHPFDPDTLGILMYAYFAIHHPTSMIRRSALERAGGYDPAQTVLEDYELFSRMLDAGCRFANLPQMLFHWRLNPAGLTCGKSAAQTLASQRVRSTAFQRLATRDRQRASWVASTLLTSFPGGTWFEDKLMQAGELQGRSHLFDALSSDALSPLAQQTLAWFDTPQGAWEPLAEELARSGYAAYGNLLARMHGATAVGALDAETVQLAHCCKVHSAVAAAREDAARSTRDDRVLMTLLVRFDGDEADLRQRLQVCAAPWIERIVFPTCNATQLEHLTRLCREEKARLSLPAAKESAWQAALDSVRGHVLGYVEPYARVVPPSLEVALAELRGGNVSVAYMPSRRYRLDALDEEGRPLPDPSYSPPRSQEILLGRRQPRLSGFIHRRSELRALTVPLRAWGDAAAGQALCSFLAHRSNLTITHQTHDEFVLPASLTDCVLTTFQRRIIEWFFDSGFGAIPAAAWDRLSPASAEAAAVSLERCFTAGGLCIHPGNQETILLFLARHLRNPWRLDVFRAACRVRGRGASAILSAAGSRHHAALASGYTTSLRFGRRMRGILRFAGP